MQAVHDMIQNRADNGQFISENGPEKPIDRDELIEMTSELLKKMHARCTAKRFRARADDNTWLAMVRAYSQCASVTASLLKDQELDELMKRIEILEDERR